MANPQRSGPEHFMCELSNSAAKAIGVVLAAVVAKSMMAVAMVERGSAKLACEPEARSLGVTTRAGASSNDEQSLGNCLT